MQKKQQDAKAAQEEIKKKAQKTETEEIPKKQQELNSHKTMHGANERKLEEMEQGVSGTCYQKSVPKVWDSTFYFYPPSVSR